MGRIATAPAARVLVACLLLAAACPQSRARGASPYLPLNMSPEIERQIERVLILADRPITSRPIAAATVLDALPAACRVDAALCARVRRYLNGYMRKVGLAHASVEVAATGGDAVVPLANRHGASSDSEWLASALGYWQPSDYVLVSLGGVGDADDAVATGSMISAGYEFAQLDIGYRDHWFSPFTDSAMLISTEARTMPSITLSNYRPLTRFGFSYEVFLAEMSHTDNIRFGDGLTSGSPRLGGLRLSIEPAAGWSLSANREVQFGGGARGGTSLGDFARALLNPQSDNLAGPAGQEGEFGNQVAAWTSRFIFPGRTPFAVYLEYAGEDRSFEGNYRLGNAALSVGITFPQLWRRFDLTYEAGEWQNAWYVSGIYIDGLTNDGRVVGHWGADRRVLADEAGAQSHMLRVGWEPSFGGLMQLQARTIANEKGYVTTDYDRGYEVSLRYSRTLRGFTAGGEILTGHDVFGEDYSRLSGFVRFGDEWAGSGGADWADDVKRPRGAELFVDAGINFGELAVRLDGSPAQTESLGVAPHLGIGARRAVSDRSDLGVRAEFDDIDGDLLISVRALDYRYRMRGPLAFSFFLGASRLDLATPAYGYYLGTGVQWRNLLPNVDAGFDLRYGDKIARDKVLPTDPPSTKRPDSFYDLTGATLSLSYRW